MKDRKNTSSSLRKIGRGLAYKIRGCYGFIFPSAIELPTQHKRVAIIQARIRSLAWILAIASPLWSLLDAFVFPYETWRSILIARLCAGAAFGSFLLIGRTFLKNQMRSLETIYLQLVILFIIPTLFYIFCHRPPEFQGTLHPLAEAVTNSYNLLPLVILACLGFFPLTLVEALAIAMPLVIVFYRSNASIDVDILSSDIGMDWVIGMMAAIATIISISQLRMLKLLINYSSYDTLTDCLGRRSGEEIARMLWHYSVRKKSHFCVAFIDLDHFKLVNDSFGHPVGDAVLANTASAIKGALRKSDFVIRWGGEEFLVIMPDANITNATNVLTRMAEQGFGTRPDGSFQTVSIGIAERINDQAEDEGLLIQVADERLYQAKIAGRGRAVGTEVVIL